MISTQDALDVFCETRFDLTLFVRLLIQYNGFLEVGEDRIQGIVHHRFVRLLTQHLLGSFVAELLIFDLASYEPSLGIIFCLSIFQRAFDQSTSLAEIRILSLSDALSFAYCLLLCERSGCCHA